MNLSFGRLTAAAVTAVAVAIGSASAWAAEKDIVDTAVSAGQFQILVAAVQAGGLVETLKGPGPFTVFAPTDAAFAKLPAGTVDTLLKPENKAKLVEVLTYHVIPGKWSAESIMAEVTKAGGKFQAKTVEGDMLTFSMKDGALWVWDESGDSAKVTIADVNQSNGVIHVIDTVLLPKMG